MEDLLEVVAPVEEEELKNLKEDVTEYKEVSMKTRQRPRLH